MAKLFLLRHLKSQWNEDDRFAGWVDNPLLKEAHADAKVIAEKLINVHKAAIDVVYTSALVRNMDTVVRIFDNFIAQYPLFLHLDGGKMQTWGNFTDISKNDLPVYVSEKLNERYYGKLQGLSKQAIEKKYGEKKSHAWRRGFAERPPGGESLKDVYNRAVPFFKKYINKDLAYGRNVLIVASHNSLRAIVKYLEDIPDKEIANVELPFGALMSYEFDEKLKLVSSRYFADK